ncbi:MAG: GWxTD domain-containing protein [candidate division Zixibacteria bacterium]|nr:GWxTD domain-containing protein [candidate division Zixibacteria bacterium]
MIRYAVYIFTAVILSISTADARTLKPGSGEHDDYLRARAHYENGDYEEARDILYGMLRYYDDDPNLNYILGMSFAGLGGTHYRNYARKYLKQAVRLEPDSLDWRYDLGLLQIESDMEEAAYDQFQEIIKRDSSYIRAYYHVMDLCIERFCHNGNRSKLAEGYRTALISQSLFPADDIIAYKKALISMLFKSYNEAAKIVSQIYRPDTLKNEITLLNAYLKYQLRDFDQSYQLFKKALSKLPVEDKAGYFDITLLLSRQQTREYDELSEAEQKKFEDRFWNGLDPDLTTEVNEKIVEHFARVYYADLMFSRPHADVHGWEMDQGQLYIRYGPPASAKWFLPEDNDAMLNCRWSWIYYFDGRPVELDFLNMFGEDNYQLAPLNYGGDVKMADDLVNEIPNVVTFAETQSLINSIFSYFIYKGPEGQAMLDLFVATPYDQFAYEPVEGHAVCSVEYRTALMDMDDSILARKKTEQQIVISPTLSKNPNFYNFATISMESPSDSLRVACAIEQKSAQRVNIYERPLRVYDFLDSGFHISSLILASKVEEKEKDSPFNRRDIKLIPNFTNTYRTDDTLIVYYEIYDLPTNIRNRTQYRMSYTIQEQDIPRNIFGMIASALSSGQKIGITHTADRGDIRTERYEPLKIDISSLDPGLYEFTITIEEFVWGKTLTRKARFSVVDDFE